MAGLAYTLLTTPTAQQKQSQLQKVQEKDSVVQQTKRQLDRNKTRLRHRKGLMRSKLAQERREEEERTRTTQEIVMTEEYRLNEMIRGRQQSRISQCTGATRYAGGCRKKIHRQQHMVKRRPEEAELLIHVDITTYGSVISRAIWWLVDRGNNCTRRAVCDNSERNDNGDVYRRGSVHRQRQCHICNARQIEADGVQLQIHVVCHAINCAVLGKQTSQHCSSTIAAGTDYRSNSANCMILCAAQYWHQVWAQLQLLQRYQQAR